MSLCDEAIYIYINNNLENNLRGYNDCTAIINNSSPKKIRGKCYGSHHY